jgi:diguanylate cyclase (GGDEF)-like protein
MRAAQSLAASETRAKHLAFHDSLTGLPNRAWLSERLAHHLEDLRHGGGAVGVLCIGLDRFKDINEVFGHRSGDRVIRETARRLARLRGPQDTLVRLGGDEFAMILAAADDHAVAALARRILDVLSGPFEVPSGTTHLACSVGAALMTGGESDGSEGLRQADLALYQAKQGGRGQWRLFDAEMDAVAKVRRAVEADLRLALQRGELRMVYQPQVNARGVITGLEALMRWTHPERGAIPPSFFIRIAEEAGIIELLGDFAIRSAFAEARRWPEVTMAVNVSALQLRSPGFVEKVARAVADTGVDPRNVELEITESVLIEEDHDARETMAALKAMGFRLALDDFGTGYSSLSYLRRFPVDRLKIDRSFVERIDSDAESEAMVRAIVRLARALNLAVIAEGVETDGQRRLLRAVGCGEAQGFFFSEPVEASQIGDLLSPRQRQSA